MGRIFINYRREDSETWARHLLYPALEQKFGKSALFLDVDADIPHRAGLSRRAAPRRRPLRRHGQPDRPQLAPHPGRTHPAA